MTIGNRFRPWYELYDYWISYACKYMRAINHIPEDNKLYDAELDAYHEFSCFRLVFESNLIEQAGMPLGETRKVIQKYFPKIPSKYIEFREILRTRKPIDQKELMAMLESLETDGISIEKITPSYVFSKKTKSVQEVLSHYTALLIAEKYSYQFIGSHLTNKNQYLQYALKNKDNETGIKEAFESMKKNANDLHKFLTEDKLKDLHRVIAENILPDDAGVNPGEYRIDTRTVGFDFTFPAPELISSAMSKFIEEANSMILRSYYRYPRDRAIFCSDAEEDIFIIAAKISYDFVRIHPFPDFNGRLSRIILCMILIIFGVPFWVSLRGSKKWKHRYLRALKSANLGDYKPYAILIAMSLVESFKEIDKNLALAGLAGILEFDNERDRARKWPLVKES